MSHATRTAIHRFSAVLVIATALLSTIAFGPDIEPAGATQIPAHVRIVCHDGAYSNAIGGQIPAFGQTHVFARFRYWNGAQWVTFRQSPVNPLPQSTSHGQYIQVSTFYLAGFTQENVGNGYFLVEAFSYTPGRGWVRHTDVVYQWNTMQLSTRYCHMR